MWYVFLYLVAIVAANLSVAYFGPSSSVINAFLFIGLDLTARDKLHLAWRGRGLVWKMGVLIASGSIISYLLNFNAGQIALASFLAFGCAAIVDAAVFHALRDKAQMVRINGSNVPSAFVDSLIFPAVAFGLPVLWGIVLGQFLAKVAGGFVWSVALGRLTKGGRQE